MYKAIVLLAATAATVSAFLPGDLNSRLLNNFQTNTMNMESLREKKGMRVSRSARPDAPLKAEHEVGDWTTIDYTDIFGCASGFAYGLQYSPN